jgi:hypothetical protein
MIQMVTSQKNLPKNQIDLTRPFARSVVSCLCCPLPDRMNEEESWNPRQNAPVENEEWHSQRASFNLPVETEGRSKAASAATPLPLPPGEYVAHTYAV